MRRSSQFPFSFGGRCLATSARARWSKGAANAAGNGAESGAATVELALSVIILFTVVLGIMQMCLLLYTYHFIAEAAREGSRYAMVHGNTCLVSGSSCTVTTSQIQNYVKNLGFPAIVAGNMTVGVSYAGFPPGTACTPNANCANPGNLVTVSVVYAFPLNIPFVPGKTISITSSSAMVVSQ